MKASVPGLVSVVCSTKIKIILGLIQRYVGYKIMEATIIQIKVVTATALLSAVICLPTICLQSLSGQQQQNESGIGDKSLQTINIQNITSQMQPLSGNESKFATYFSPELGIQIDHPTDWSPIIRKFPDQVQVLEFNTSRSEMMQLLPPTVRISSAPQPDIPNLQQLTETLLSIASNYPKFDLKDNATQALGNVTAQKVLYTYGSADPSQQLSLQAMDIWTIKDGKRYVFSYIAPVSEFSINLPVVERMLNSLSFG